MIDKIKCLLNNHQYSDQPLQLDPKWLALIASKRCKNCGRIEEITIPLEKLWEFFDKC